MPYLARVGQEVDSYTDTLGRYLELSEYALDLLVNKVS